MSPDLVDFDGDGDLDAMVGEYDGNVNFLANTGSVSVPRFVLRTGSANPFAAIDVGQASCAGAARPRQRRRSRRA